MKPEPGEIIKAREVFPYGKGYLIWQACKGCGNLRWVRLIRGIPKYFWCPVCAGKRRSGILNGKWKGGKYQNPAGYVMVLLPHDSPFLPMANCQRVLAEHRLVMAQRLGRCLLRTEHIHHINGIKDDNRNDNLQLFTRSNHELRNQFCANCELRKEIRLLRWQIKQLIGQSQGRLFNEKLI